jgi:hypothetical protein
LPSSAFLSSSSFPASRASVLSARRAERATLTLEGGGRRGGEGAAQRDSRPAVLDRPHKCRSAGEQTELARQSSYGRRQMGCGQSAWQCREQSRSQAARARGTCAPPGVLQRGGRLALLREAGGRHPAPPVGLHDHGRALAPHEVVLRPRLRRGSERGCVAWG